jgi:hypothetical protein
MRIMAMVMLPFLKNSRPESIAHIRNAARIGLAVLTGMGMPASFAVIVSVSMRSGLACAEAACAASTVECSAPAAISGWLRSQSG